jgi:hypothetical protein
MNDPRAKPVDVCSVQRQCRAESALIFLRNFPNDKLVVSTVSSAVLASSLCGLASRTMPMRHIRYDLVLSPAPNAQDCVFVRAPNSPRSHDGEIPQHHVPFRISCHQPVILPDESCGMDCSFVPPKDELGRRYRTSHCSAGARRSGWYRSVVTAISYPYCALEIYRAPNSAGKEVQLHCHAGVGRWAKTPPDCISTPSGTSRAESTTKHHFTHAYLRTLAITPTLGKFI